MVSSHTTRKRLEKQGVGENNNAWGGYLNLNTIDLIDECFGVVCVAMTTAGDSTLSTNNGLSDEGRRSQIVLTGAPTTVRAGLNLPAVQSFYLIRNKMTGANKVHIRNAGGTNGVDFSGSGSGAEQGVVISDGTNVREVFRTVSVGSFTIFTRGMIMPFFNSVGAIPTGWLNCDGTNGTPNLNDRFILGTTSNSNVDTSGGAVALTATSNGDHSHGDATGSTVLTSANIPAHSHYIMIGGATDQGGNTIPNATLANTKLQAFHVFGNAADYTLCGIVTAASPSIGQTSFAYSSAASGHTHTIASGGGHTHSITDGRPPYHRLLYIMKA